MVDTVFLIIHLLVLILINYLSIKKKSLPGIASISLAIFILLWFELILTGYTLSMFSQLGNRFLYIITSTIYACLISFTISKFFQADEFSETEYKDFKMIDYIKTLIRKEKGFIFLSMILFGVVFLALLICIFNYPNNPDSESYRLPRVYFYRSHGSLSHFANGVDPRLIFYPLNGVLGHMIVAIHNVDLRWFHLFTFSAWISVLICSYALSRELKNSRTSSIFASLIVSTTPVFFTLSSAGNDEVLAVSGLFIGFYFGLLWLKKDISLYWFFSLIGLTISVAVKEHFVFYFLFFLAVGVWILFTGKIPVVYQFVRRKLNYLLFSTLSVLVSISVSPLINYVDKKTMSSDLAQPLLNKPFNFFLPIQNFFIFLLQMVLNPIPDLVWFRSMDKRVEYYTKFQFYFNKLSKWINTQSDFFSPFDPFRGFLLIPEAAYRTETTIWLGYAPVFAVFIFIIYFNKKYWRNSLYPWFVTSFFFWILGFSSLLKFQYTVQTYFTYPYVFLAPVIAFALNDLKNRKIFLRSLLKFAVCLLLVTNLLATFYIGRDNIRRNFRDIFKARFKDYYSDFMNTELVALLKKEKNIHIMFTHWEMPLMHIMRRNPAAKFTVENDLFKDKNSDAINLLIYQAISNYHNIPLSLPTKNTPGLTYLGKVYSAYGPEFVFANGKDLPEFKDKFVVLLNYTLQYVPDSSGNMIFNFKIVTSYRGGESPEDNLKYSFRIKDEKGNILTESNWSQVLTKAVELSGKVRDNKNFLEILVTEGNNTGKKYTYNVSLSDGVEYFVNAPK